MISNPDFIDFNSIFNQLKKHLHYFSKKSIPDLKFSDLEEVSNAGNNWCYKIIKEDLKLFLKIGIAELDYKNFEKVEFLSNELEKNNFFRVPKVLYCGRFMGNDNIFYSFMVQELIDGKGLPFNIKTHNLLPEIAKLLYNIHNEISEDILFRIKLKLNFSSWMNFLQDYIKENLNILFENKIIDEFSKNKYSNLYMNLLYKNSILINNAKMSFLKADIIPPNFLVNDNETKIIALVDWDFAIVGDPAFELSFNRSHYLEHYIKLAKKLNPYFDESEFRYKLDLYFPIMSLGILISILKKNKNIVFRDNLIEKWVEKSLNNLLKYNN